MNRSVFYSSLSDSLREEWVQLWQKSPTATIENSPGWFEAACEAFQYDEKIILAVYDTRSKELVAIVPLVKVRLYGLPIFTMPGLNFTTHTSILGDFSEDILKKEIVTEIKKRGTVYLTGLTRAHADSFSQFKNIVSSFPSDQEYFMDLAKGPAGELSERRVRVICNKIKRLPEHATIRMVTEQHVLALHTCFAIDQMSAKHKKGMGVFWRGDARLFYTLLVEKHPSNISITLLFVGNKPVAYDMCFQHRNIYVGSQKAYLSEYGYCNPWFFMFIKRMESIMLNNPVEISMGKGHSRAKTDLTKNMRVLYSAIISERYFNRLFLTFMLSAREKMYHAVVAHPKLYARYKLLKI
jgi:Acetyltransferase (GNAT) domain